MFGLQLSQVAMLNKSGLSKIIINELKDKHHYINTSISSTSPCDLCFNYFEGLNKNWLEQKVMF